MCVMIRVLDEPRSLIHHINTPSFDSLKIPLCFTQTPYQTAPSSLLSLPPLFKLNFVSIDRLVFLPLQAHRIRSIRSC